VKLHAHLSSSTRRLAGVRPCSAADRVWGYWDKTALIAFSAPGGKPLARFRLFPFRVSGRKVQSGQEEPRSPGQGTNSWIHSVFIFQPVPERNRLLFRLSDSSVRCLSFLRPGHQLALFSRARSAAQEAFEAENLAISLTAAAAIGARNRPLTGSERPRRCSLPLVTRTGVGCCRFCHDYEKHVCQCFDSEPRPVSLSVRRTAAPVRQVRRCSIRWFRQWSASSLFQMTH
jgi:hypothetical protein